MQIIIIHPKITKKNAINHHIVSKLKQIHINSRISKIYFGKTKYCEQFYKILLDMGVVGVNDE